MQKTERKTYCDICKKAITYGASVVIKSDVRQLADITLSIVPTVSSARCGRERDTLDDFDFCPPCLLKALVGKAVIIYAAEEDIVDMPTLKIVEEIKK